MDSLSKKLLVKHSFKAFLIKSFKTVCPSEVYQDNWHIDLILKNLELIEKQKIKRLLINLPPRSLKSIVISVAWPAWLLGKDPSKKIIVASYSQKLSEKLSFDCKLIIKSKWYRKLFPATKIASGGNEKFKFITTLQGFRFATSVGGTLTGEGADIIIIDDPHTPLQALSVAERERTLNWYDQTLATRLNNKKCGAIIVVMQRLHKDDLTGHLLAKKTWQQLKIPAIADSNEKWAFEDFHCNRSTGEFLHPNREGSMEIEIAKIELGSYAFNAQYQQNPMSNNSSLLCYGWIERYKEFPQCTSIYQSWDCAIKDGELSDYSVCTSWGVNGNQYYLLDVLRKKINYPELKKIVIELAYQFPTTAILIEDKASGQVLVQELSKSLTTPIIPILPQLDKVSRFINILTFFETRRIVLPVNATWLNEYEAELLSFPETKFDDQVDSTTQFFNWIVKKSRTTGVGIRRIE